MTMICVKIRLDQWVSQKCRNHESGLENELISVRPRKQRLDGLSTGCEERIASDHRTCSSYLRETDKGKEDIT